MSSSQVIEATNANINHAINLLRQDGLVAFPTETVYGLGADARSVNAVRSIFTAKGRPENHPLIVHIGEVSELAQWASEIPDSAMRLADAFWPGPLTIILRRGKHVIDAVTGGQSTIGLRIPAHPVALALLRGFGSGIAAPSANRFGQISPTTAAHVAKGLGDKVSLILDGGSCTVGIESSIVDCTGAVPRLLRSGMLNRNIIEAVLGIKFDQDSDDSPRVSGSHASHYAPRTQARWLSKDAIAEALMQNTAELSMGVIALHAQSETGSSARVWRNLSNDPLVYAHELYAQLHELDALNLDLILLEAPPDTDMWDAIRDRLRRATGSKLQTDYSI